MFRSLVNGLNPFISRTPLTGEKLIPKSKSVTERVRELEAEGRLVRFAPRSRHTLKRAIFLTDLAQREFDDRSSAVNLLCGRGYIEGALAHWVTGGLVYSSRRKGGFLKRLAPPPPEVWEIRVTEPVVHARLLGRFAAPDVLIVSKMHTRRLLGDKGSPEWSAAMSNSVRQWETMFGDLQPFSADHIHAYVTSNCDDFSI